MFRATASLVVALLLSATTALAQVDKRFDVHIGGGYTFTAGESRDHVADSVNGVAGFTVNVGEKIGLQLEYGFVRGRDKEVMIPVASAPGAPGDVQGAFTASMNMHYGNVNIIVKPRPGSRVSPYMLAGLGLYHRRLDIASPATGYVAGFCNPWWYACYPGVWSPVANVTGNRNSTDFGMDVGGGVNFGPGSGPRFYVEARYHYVWGPEVKTGGSGTKKGDGQFLPITVGLRF